MSKVKCSNCTNLYKNRCTLKKVKVHINKKRYCTYFEKTTLKTVIKPKPFSKYIPFNLRNKKPNKGLLKEGQEKIIEMPNSEMVLKDPDCLSKFRSTAE